LSGWSILFTPANVLPEASEEMSAFIRTVCKVFQAKPVFNCKKCTHIGHSSSKSLGIGKRVLFFWDLGELEDIPFHRYILNPTTFRQVLYIPGILASLPSSLGQRRTLFSWPWDLEARLGISELVPQGQRT
jgi:hypothetical protein